MPMKYVRCSMKLKVEHLAKFIKQKTLIPVGSRSFVRGQFYQVNYSSELRIRVQNDIPTEEALTHDNN